MQPIPYELLVDLAQGRMLPEEATALRVRVAADPDGQATLAAIEALIGLMSSDHSTDAPEHVINRAVRLMSQRIVPANAGPLRQLTAILRSDSWRTPQLAFGLRSVQVWPRALLLNAGDRELDLQISPHGNNWQLQGQVLGPEEPGSIVLNSVDERVTALLNEFGEFTLPPVAAGRYNLTVRQGNLEIVVPDLELGSSSNRS